MLIKTCLLGFKEHIYLHFVILWVSTNYILINICDIFDRQKKILTSIFKDEENFLYRMEYEMSLLPLDMVKYLDSWLINMPN